MDKQKLKQYFLGNLSEAENNLFEEEIALDEKLTEAAQIVESELIDDYLRGNLSASDRELFGAIYLTTEARREKLSLAKSLWRVANEQKVSEIVAAETSLSFWQTWNAWRVAFAGVAAITLVGAFVFLWLNSRDKGEIVQQQNSNQLLTLKAENRNTQPIENVNSVYRNVNNSNLPRIKNVAPTPALKKTPTPAPKTIPTPPPMKQSAPTLASFTLLPGTLRDEGEQFIKIAPTAQKINLRLNLPKDATKYQTYSVVLKTADGETVFTAPNLKSLNLTLPAKKLENRTYIIFLEAQNAQNTPESAAEYTFRVRR